MDVTGDWRRYAGPLRETDYGASMKQMDRGIRGRSSRDQIEGTRNSLSFCVCGIYIKFCSLRLMFLG